MLLSSGPPELSPHFLQPAGVIGSLCAIHWSQAASISGPTCSHVERPVSLTPDGLHNFLMKAGPADDYARQSLTPKQVSSKASNSQVGQILQVLYIDCCRGTDLLGATW